MLKLLFVAIRCGSVEGSSYASINSGCVFNAAVLDKNAARFEWYEKETQYLFVPEKVNAGCGSGFSSQGAVFVVQTSVCRIARMFGINPGRLKSELQT